MYFIKLIFQPVDDDEDYIIDKQAVIDDHNKTEPKPVTPEKPVVEVVKAPDNKHVSN